MSQMINVLDLVTSIIGETLIKEERWRSIFHHNIWFLKPVGKARHSYNRRHGRESKPLWIHILLQMIHLSFSHMSDCTSLVIQTSFFLNTLQKWSTVQREKTFTKHSTIHKTFALWQHKILVQEKTRNNYSCRWRIQDVFGNLHDLWI